MKSFAFGWELNSVKQNGADMFCEITRDITVCGIEMDVAFMVVDPPAIFNKGSFAEVLCSASVIPAKPAFAPGPAAYAAGAGPALEFGPARFYTPAASIGCHGGSGGSGVLALAILKTWVASPPMSSAAQRNVVVTGLSMLAPAGSYLVFHMDHMGYGGDVEMQGVLFYL